MGRAKTFGRLNQYDLIRQFVNVTLDRRKGTLKLGVYAIESCNHTFGELSPRKGRTHLSAGLFPDCMRNSSAGFAIYNQLHGLVGQQQINKHAVVTLGIPYAQARKMMLRTLTRRHFGKHSISVE